MNQTQVPSTQWVILRTILWWELDHSFWLPLAIDFWSNKQKNKSLIRSRNNELNPTQPIIGAKFKIPRLLGQQKSKRLANLTKLNFNAEIFANLLRACWTWKFFNECLPLRDSVAISWRPLLMQSWPHKEQSLGLKFHASSTRKLICEFSHPYKADTDLWENANQINSFTVRLNWKVSSKGEWPYFPNASPILSKDRIRQDFLCVKVSKLYFPW